VCGFGPAGLAGWLGLRKGSAYYAFVGKKFLGGRLRCQGVPCDSCVISGGGFGGGTGLAGRLIQGAQFPLIWVGFTQSWAI